MVMFTARQNLANLNEVKMNLIVKCANLAGKSYVTMSFVQRFIIMTTYRVCMHACMHVNVYMCTCIYACICL